MRKISLLICFFALEIIFSNNVLAGNLVKWELTADNAGLPDEIDSKVGSADFRFGDGVGHKKFDSSGAYGTSLQTSNLDNTAYFEFQLAPKLGETLNISQISFEEARSPEGARNFQVESSKDGSFLDNEILYSGSGTFITPEAHSLVTIDNLDIVVNESESIFFRIYGWGAEGISPQLGRFYVRNFTIEEDSESPAAISISRTSSDLYTNTNPNLTLSATDNIAVTQMSFSCDGISFSTWENYNTIKNNFDLKSGNYGCEDQDGNKGVFVKFRDANLNESAIISTGIFTLDTTNPKLISVDMTTSNSNVNWAKADDIVTYKLTFSEDVKLNIKNSNTIADNASILKQDITLNTFKNTDEIIFQTKAGDNGVISINSADFQIIDQAGNIQNITAADINNLINTVITADTISPTITNTTIYSNNTLDNSLSKTNDTIVVEFTATDNLSSNLAFIGNAQILNKNAISNINNTGSGKIELFTDGSENSEIIVPFAFSITDAAGNISILKTTTDDGSQVKFDRTNPLVKNVEISATSLDNSAYVGDAPTYYSKQGDSVILNLQTCDYVDTNNNAPRGTLFNQSVTAVDLGLTNENCVTLGGKAGIWRQWRISLDNVNGAEGVITFDIEVSDNAGNNDAAIIHVTGTTNGSQVVFDKTSPSLPTSVIDNSGAATTEFKHHSDAIYTWTGAQDLVSGIYSYGVNLVNSDVSYNETAQVLAPANSYNFESHKVLPSANTDYVFNLSVKDKAGNGTGFASLYQQKYTVNFYGQVLNKNRQPVSGATIQIFSEGNFCNKLLSPCSVITNQNGEYAILLQGKIEYQLNVFANGYELLQDEINITNEDFARDYELNNNVPIQNTNNTVTETVISEGNGSGKADLRMRGEYRELSILGRKEPISYEESMALAKKANEGVRAGLAYYVNRNGYEIFAGYIPGKLPLDKVGARAQNQIIYRGEKHWQAPQLTPPDYVAEKLAIAKDLFQKNEVNEKSQFSANGLRKLIRPRVGNESVRHLMRMEVVNNNVNKFERRSEVSPYKAVSRIDAKKDMNLVKFKVGGKSFSMAEYLQN